MPPKPVPVTNKPSGIATSKPTTTKPAATTLTKPAGHTTTQTKPTGVVTKPIIGKVNEVKPVGTAQKPANNLGVKMGVQKPIAVNAGNAQKLADEEAAKKLVNEKKR